MRPLKTSGYEEPSSVPGYHYLRSKKTAVPEFLVPDGYSGQVQFDYELWREAPNPLPDAPWAKIVPTRRPRGSLDKGYYQIFPAGSQNVITSQEFERGGYTTIRPALESAFSSYATTAKRAVFKSAGWVPGDTSDGASECWELEGTGGASAVYTYPDETGVWYWQVGDYQGRSESLEEAKSAVEEMS